MSAEAVGDTQVTRPTGVCVVRSLPIDHTRKYTVITNLDVEQESAKRIDTVYDIDEVLRLVVRFLYDSSE